MAQISPADITPPNGRFFRQVAYYVAYRDANAVTRMAMDAECKAELAKWEAAFSRKVLPSHSENRHETLSPQLAGLAHKARTLAEQNDPDAVRAGLAEIAAALDALRQT